MAFFKEFPIIKYQGKKAVDILTAILPRYSPIKDTTLYFYYDLQDGERPEDVSYQFYKTTEHHWILILLNNVIDPFYDWLLSQYDLEKYMRDKYGDGLNDVHHFIDLNTGKQVDDLDDLKYREMIDNGQPLPHYISPISNRDYEIEKNEEKRRIKVIAPQYINDVIKQFEDEMSKYGN